MASDESASHRSISFGIALVVVGTFALIFTKDIGKGFGSTFDPGPKLMPLILSIILIVGGVIETVLATIKRARLSGRLSLKDWGTQNFILVLFMLLMYVPVMNIAGFMLATFLFCVALMLRLRTRLWLAIVMPVVIVALAHVLFVMLFKVQLPTGELGLPF